MEEGQLRVWKDAYGAPSLDQVSLYAMIYARINGMTGLTFIYGRLPLWSAVPRYMDVTGVYKKPQDIMRAICDALDGNDLDTRDYQSEVRKIAVYNHYITNSLEFAYASAFYYSSENYATVTKPYYYGIIPFPFKYYYVCKFAEEYHKKADVARGRLELDRFLNDRMEDADRCIMTLSEILGERPYIFGSDACSLDALLYSYLAPLYYAPLQNFEFQVRLKSYYNLCRYIVRLTTTYFPEVKYQAPKPEDEDEQAPSWQIALAGVSALTIMCWFAYSKGLIRVVF